MNQDILNKQAIISRLSSVLGISKIDANFLYRLLPSSCCPSPITLNFYRDEFVNPINGTTTLNLTYSPTTMFPPIVTRGGSQILSTDFSILGNVLTLNDPITSSPGGAGSEDIIITYSY